jgi:hypothetical protein
MRRTLLALLALTFVGACAPPDAAPPDPIVADDVTAQRVRDQIAFAWGKYVEHAWGHDELRPLTATGSDWSNAGPLGLTIVDAADTLHLAGLTDERDRAIAWLGSELRVDLDAGVSVFETNIRVLGGLLSAYEITQDPALLDKATDLGERLLPAFDTPTGMPRPTVNLATGLASGGESNVAQIGTFVLEFGALSQWTGDDRFDAAARRALDALHDRRDPHTGLLGSAYDVDTGELTLPIAQTGGGTDSTYEYLLKGALLFEDAGLRDQWDADIQALHAHLADRTADGLWYGYADPASGELTLPLSGALACFLPGTLALSGDLERGVDHGLACDAARQRFGLVPDAFDYRAWTVFSPNYDLRPEVAESYFILYRRTRDEVWRERGRALLDTLVERCRVDEGFATLSDVRTGAQSDGMPSFFLAETLKYLLLLFREGEAVPLDEWVFNTEAHPLRIRAGARPG